MARAAVFAVPVLVFLGLYAGALDYELTWTDASAIGDGTMLRPPGEILAAFGEPLHRVEYRGSEVVQAYYRPLQVVLLSVVDAMTDAGPRHLRAAGLAVGALCLLAFAALSLALLGSPGPALFATLLVAVHPVAIETYVWIAGISGGLCGLFAIASLGAALAATRASKSGPRIAFAALSVGALALGLLSKERAVVTPALLAAALLAGMLARVAAGRSRAAWGLVAAQGVLVAGYWLLWRPRVIGSSVVALPPIGGSQTTQWLTAISTWPDQLAWLLLPLHSSTSDVVTIATGPGEPRAWLGALLALGSAVAAIALATRGRPVAALGLAWIWIAFLPTAGLLPMLHARAERYLFLSSFGLALFLAAGAPALLSRLAPRRRWIAPALAALLVAILAQRTAARLPLWESDLSLFGTEVAADPAYREAYFLLAVEHASHGRRTEADAQLARLLADDDVFAGTASYLNWISVYDLACSNTLALGRHRDVLALAREVERRQPGIARLPSFRTCVGQAHNALGQTEEALALYLAAEEAVDGPAPPRLYVMIARNYVKLGRDLEANAWLARASRQAAGDPELDAQIRRLRARLAAGGR